MILKKICCLLALVLLLSGCAGVPTFEGVQDVYAPEAAPEPKKIGLTLPEDAASQVLAGSSGVLYFCDGYEITAETFASGDLNATLQSISGFAREELTLLETASDSIKRYECVWTSVSGEGERVSRAVILDDGYYHYCVCVFADAEDSGVLQGSWQALLGSIVLR